MKDIKNQLKAIAVKTARTLGIHGITFRDLGKATNIKSSSVFYHFGSKDKLLQEIVEDYKNDFLEKLKKIDDREVSPLDKMLALVTIFEEPYKNKSFCLCGMFAAEFNALEEQTILVLNQFFDEVEKWIVKIIVKDKKLSAKEAKIYAAIIISGLEGALMLDRVKGNLSHLQAMKIWISQLLV